MHASAETGAPTIGVAAAEIPPAPPVAPPAIAAPEAQKVRATRRNVSEDLKFAGFITEGQKAITTVGYQNGFLFMVPYKAWDLTEQPLADWLGTLGSVGFGKYFPWIYLGATVANLVALGIAIQQERKRPPQPQQQTQPQPEPQNNAPGDNLKTGPEPSPEDMAAFTRATGATS